MQEIAKLEQYRYTGTVYLIYFVAYSTVTEVGILGMIASGHHPRIFS